MLKTKGGEEYCGKVIHTSLTDLNWGASEEDLQLIYIAGNEPFTQGNLSFETACGIAKQKGIMVNTIFCGNRLEGLNTGWLKGATLTGGEFMNIDQDKATVYIATPYDAEISQLNDELNTTYLPYAAFKSSKKYKNEKWDLVDAYEKDKKIVKKTKVLPQALQGKSEAEIEKEIIKKKEERIAIQTKIKTLDTQRKNFKKEQSKLKKDNTNLENSILKTIKKQAKQKGYKVEE